MWLLKYSLSNFLLSGWRAQNHFFLWNICLAIIDQCNIGVYIQNLTYESKQLLFYFRLSPKKSRVNFLTSSDLSNGFLLEYCYYVLLNANMWCLYNSGPTTSSTWLLYNGELTNTSYSTQTTSFLGVMASLSVSSQLPPKSLPSA